MYRQVCHAHCPKPSGGGAIAAVVLVLVVIAVIARPAEHAARTAEHIAVDVVEVLAITLGAAIVLGAAAAVAAVVLSSRRTRARQALAAQQNYTAVIPGAVIAGAVQAVSEPPLAIEAPRPSLDELRALAAEHGHQLVPAEVRRPFVPGVIPLEVDD